MLRITRRVRGLGPRDLVRNRFDTLRERPTLKGQTFQPLGVHPLGVNGDAPQRSVDVSVSSALSAVTVHIAKRTQTLTNLCFPGLRICPDNALKRNPSSTCTGHAAMVVNGVLEGTWQSVAKMQIISECE